METITQRRKLQTCGAESAAIALTAQLLSGLRTSAADAIYLIPSSQGPRYYPDWYGLDNSARSDDGSSWFQRRHDSDYGATWFGAETLIDQHGRQWERRYKAVQDDFGNLVEVPR